MIKNVIFDMGGVLLRFDADYFIRRAGITGEDARILKQEVFRSLEWAMQDRGSITEEGSVRAICARLPQHLHQAVHDLVFDWSDPIEPVEGMAQLVRELKERGFGVFLLSNASVRQHAYWPEVPGAALFDGTLISADVGLVKPEPEIYRLACEKFGIRAEECAFIDDTPLNAEGAQHIGMHAVVFHGDVAALRRWLAQELNEPALQNGGSSRAAAKACPRIY